MFKSFRKVWFDLDGTLIDTTPSLLRSAKSLGFHVEDEPKAYYLGSSMTREEMDIVIQDALFNNYRELGPVDNSVKAFLTELYLRAGKVPIKIVTSRRVAPGTFYATHETLRQVFPKIRFSIDLTNGMHKSRFAPGVRICFEDRRATALDLATRGYIVFLRNASYNQIGHFELDLITQGYTRYTLNREYEKSRNLDDIPRYSIFMEYLNENPVFPVSPVGHECGIYRFDDYSQLMNLDIIKFLS